MANPVDWLLELIGAKSKKKEPLKAPIPDNELHARKIAASNLMNPQWNPSPEEYENWQKANALSASPSQQPGQTAQPQESEIEEIAKALSSDSSFFGEGEETAEMQPELFDLLMSMDMTATERRNIAELSGQESSYGYAGPNISDIEESYGPYHINLRAGRIDPVTGEAFTKEGASDIDRATQHAIEQYRLTGGLGAWNPGAYDHYQYGIPERAKKKKFVRGK